VTADSTGEVRGQYRALCCECGNLRYVSRRARPHGFMPELPAGSPVLEYGRVTCNRECDICERDYPARSAARRRSPSGSQFRYALKLAQATEGGGVAARLP
jgi:hypothetical protein